MTAPGASILADPCQDLGGIELDDDPVHIHEPLDPDRALCGVDLTGAPLLPEEEVPEGDRCAKCREIERARLEAGR